MQPTRLWFLRHGEIEAGKVGAFIGRSEADLSPLGKHQAEAIKVYLESAAVDAIVASPRRRAKDTVRPLASASGRIVDVRPGFAEMDFGSWEGKMWEDILRSDAAIAEEWQADPGAVACPGGESGNAFAARIDEALANLLAEFKGRSVVLAAHAGTNRAILGHILKRPYMDCFAFAQDYGCINAAGWSEEGFGQIALVNFVPGPRADKQDDE
ncbi:MAG: histidine phosphatase family protein [bacterium]